jgi:uncharacterized membrane protein
MIAMPNLFTMLTRLDPLLEAVAIIALIVFAAIGAFVLWRRHRKRRHRRRGQGWIHY